MSTYKPLNCDLYDYLEIACLHGYELLLELDDGSTLQARAVDTRTAPSKEEFLKLQNNEGAFELRLDRLVAITPTEARASFKRIELAGQFCSTDD
ncbi:Rho-binding antiterminator [Pseudomonas marincola]|uniref:Rho-binding antiterminator n=1 Tax=Pseudomonas marincola TaxID=437900 RepID=UPI0008E46291|nr:Rho-binding antiterminator [Pseudomonas marincola]SFT39946.1 transcriptional antiterminator, Rof [Pseudomonas marincola]|tara:strand:- start:256 stop:540 length:285 start_codon:yes stop_codon:yes gene_type:complete